MPQNQDWSPASVVLKEHIDRIMAEREKLFNVRLEALGEKNEIRLQSVEKAIAVALQANEKRLHGMNEFRDTLRDQASHLATKEEVAIIRQAQQERLTIAAFSAEHRGLTTRIEALELTGAKLEGKASQRDVDQLRSDQMRNLVITLFSIGIALAGLALGFFGH